MRTAIDDLLPIGSVVEVFGVDKKLMIYGRMQIQGQTGEVWDYVACGYPQGNVSSAQNVFFDREQVRNVIFRGYEDQEERVLKLQLLPLLKNKK